MKKLQNKNGMTLLETLVALLVMVFMIVGIGVGMDAATRISSEAAFESDSATLSGIINTSVGDILRYSRDVRTPDQGGMYVYNASVFEDSTSTRLYDVSFVFTSTDYGVQDAYFFIPTESDSAGKLCLKNLRKDTTVDLVNNGAYPDLKITDFSVKYEPVTNKDAHKGGYFNVSYKIVSVSDSTRSHDFSCCVRLMNTV